MPTAKRRKYLCRIAEAMSHTSRYAFEGQSKLARDCKLNKSTVGNLLSGRHTPRYKAVVLVVEALERQLGCKLSIRDLISYDGAFVRPICAVVGCPGCLPDEAINADGTVSPAYHGIKAGEWMSFLTPSGLAEGQDL